MRSPMEREQLSTGAVTEWQRQPVEKEQEECGDVLEDVKYL